MAMNEVDYLNRFKGNKRVSILYNYYGDRMSDTFTLAQPCDFVYLGAGINNATFNAVNPTLNDVQMAFKGETLTFENPSGVTNKVSLGADGVSVSITRTNSQGYISPQFGKYVDA